MRGPFCNAGLHRRSNSIPSVVQTSAASVATVALGAAAGVIVARTLGPHGRGVYAIATIAPTFIGVVGTLGVEEAIVYLAGRAADRRTTSHLVWGSLLLAFILGSVASAVSVAFQFLVFWKPNLGVSGVLFGAIACQPLQFALTQVSCAHLRAQARYTVWNGIRILVGVVYLLGLSIVIVAGRLTVDGAILCLLAGSVSVLIASVLSVVISHRSATSREAHGPATSRNAMKEMLSFGWKNHLITVQTVANQQLDQVLLAAMVPAAQLGQYAVAVTYASAGLSLGVSPALQMYSHFSRQQNPDRAAYRRLVIRTQLMLLAICLITAGLAPFFIPFVSGKSYDPAVTPALILILSSPMLSLGAIFSALWKSAGRPLIAAKAQGIGLILTAATLPVSIIYLGINGAAIVSIVVYGVIAIWLWRSKPFDGLLATKVSKEPGDTGAISNLKRSPMRGRHVRNSTPDSGLPSGDAALLATRADAGARGIRYLIDHSFRDE
jgi:O-antigen/teichoic acid export membrane protein